MAVMKKSMMNMIVGGGDAATMNNDTKYVEVLTIIAQPLESCLGQRPRGCWGPPEALLFDSLFLVTEPAYSTPYRWFCTLAKSCKTRLLYHEGAHHHLIAPQETKAFGVELGVHSFCYRSGVIGSAENSQT